MDPRMENSSFVLEHLATFTVCKENNDTGIIYPEDGMRRLLELEKSTGIWSQKMEMTMSRNQIQIHDFDTKSLIEKFPVDWIESPTPFTNPNPLELYNNILVFIVAPPAGIAIQHYPEMHIFQCQNIDAKLLSDYLSHIKNDMDYIAEKPLYSKEMKSDQQQGGGGAGGGAAAGTGARYKAVAENDIPMTTQHERDVKLLNYCFDDIEKFIARLQHSAAASRELERRRKKQKEGYLPPGQGLLSIRTRPPTEPEFIDIFAKFKLSFNLLAKLRAHIHDPNAPELVHFLFTPLALIVDAAHDLSMSMERSRNSNAVLNVPSQVISPLLTTDAINLLLNCVSSKETELWRSLGDAWQLSKDEFLSKYDVDLNHLNYTPKFFDGWSPDFPIVLEDAYSHQHMAPTTSSEPSYPHNEPLDNISDDSIDNSTIPHQHEAAPETSTKYEERLSQWIRELQNKKAKIFRVTYPRTANNEKELSVVRGEILEVLDDTRKWWKARNILGQTAHVPHTIVTRYSPSDSKDVFENPLYSQKRNPDTHK